MIDLKNKVVSGVRWTGFSSAFTAIGYILLMFFLVRTLEKSDFGLFAITGVFLNLGTLFMNFGISDAIIQKQDLNKSEFSTLYWLNIILSIFIFSLLLFIAPYVAIFYEQPALKSLIFWVAVGVVLLAPGLQFYALFQKEMNFKVLSKIEILSFSGFALSAVVLATNGYGVYSLLWATLCRYSLKTILCIIFSERSKYPEFFFSKNDLKTFRRFGVFQTGRGILVQIVMQMDVLILGKLLGSEATGIYDVLKGILNKFAGLISPVISTIGLPVFAANQMDLSKNSNIYLKVLLWTNALTMPVFLVALVLAKPIVSVFFGAEWSDFALVFQWLCIAAAAVALVRPQGSLITAMGKPEYGLIWNIFHFVLLPIVFYLGSENLENIAKNYALFNLVSVFFAFQFIVRRLLPIAWSTIIKTIFPVLGVSLLVGIIIFFSLDYTDNNLQKLLIGGLIAGIAIPIGFRLILPELNDDLRAVLGIGEK